jgi:hypothetical protein
MINLFKCAIAVLSENGIEGTFTIENAPKDPSMAWNLLPRAAALHFFDDKHQFIYELKGGDKVFIPKINDRFLELLTYELAINSTIVEAKSKQYKKVLIDVEQHYT